MTAHRYWRLYVTASNGSTWHQAGAELQLRLTRGGADQCAGGTPITSGDEGSYTAANLFDDDPATFQQWQGSALPKWVAYDFGAGNEQAIVELALFPHSSYADRMPKDFELQWSDDGIDWTPHLVVSEETGWVAGAWRTFFHDPAVPTVATVAQAAIELLASPVPQARLAHGTVETLSAPDPHPRLAHSAVELLILAHVDPRLAHAVVEVMTRARPDGGTIELDPIDARLSVTASGALDADLYGSAALGVTVAAERFDLGTPLSAAAAALGLTADAALDLGSVLEAAAAIGLTTDSPVLEVGVALAGEAAVIAVRTAGALAAPSGLAGVAALSFTGAGELLIGQELRAAAALHVAARGALLVHPERPSGFFLLF